MITRRDSAVPPTREEVAVSIEPGTSPSSHDAALAAARRDRATAAALQAAIEQRLGDHDADPDGSARHEGGAAALAAVAARPA